MHLALVPADTMVAPESEFVVRLVVTQAGSAFNGYDATVVYDPAALTFLAASPLSMQEGWYMRGVCGNTFHIFKSAGDSLTITDVLLCADSTRSGPGVLYKLKFRAAGSPRWTWVRLRSAQFYNAGFRVTPVHKTDALLHIGTVTGSEPPAAQGLRLEAAPNPFNPTTVIHVEAGGPGRQSLRVYDARGRPVRLLQRGLFQAGGRDVLWDGLDDAGARLASGVYLVMLRAGDRGAQRHVVLLK